MDPIWKDAMLRELGEAAEIMPIPEIPFPAPKFELGEPLLVGFPPCQMTAKRPSPMSEIRLRFKKP